MFSFYEIANGEFLLAELVTLVSTGRGGNISLY